MTQTLARPFALDSSQWLHTSGRLLSVEGRMNATIDAGLGELVRITSTSGRSVLAEVIGFNDDVAQLMPYQAGVDFQRGNVVVSTGRRIRFPVGTELLGESWMPWDVRWTVWAHWVVAIVCRFILNRRIRSADR